MKKLPPQTAAALAVALIVVAAAVASWGMLAAIGLPLSQDEYNLASWELRHFPNKWLYEIGHLGDDGPDTQSENEVIRRYLDLERSVFSLQDDLNREAATNAPPEEQQATQRELEETRAERDSIQRQVEAVLEGRIGAVASDLGLRTTLPLFSDVHWLFPPVDFEFEDPPYVLVISPRDRIVEEEATLLRSDLTLGDVERLEQDAESKSDNVSVLVVPTGGVAAYPAIIERTDDYLRALRVASHEWLHGYLYFQPLGARYFESDALRTMNETVADIAGEEIGSLVEAAYPLPPSPSPTPAPGPTPQDSVDVDKVLRQLRLDVDRLLAEGKVDEAEAQMEETRQFLADHGRYFRRINQAFFAFYGLYGTSAASSSPIGPKLEELRQKSASLGDFIRAASQLTSEADLDRLLAEAIRP